MTDMSVLAAAARLTPGMRRDVALTLLRQAGLPAETAIPVKLLMQKDRVHCVIFKPPFPTNIAIRGIGLGQPVASLRQSHEVMTLPPDSKLMKGGGHYIPLLNDQIEIFVGADRQGRVSALFLFRYGHLRDHDPGAWTAMRTLARDQARLAEEQKRKIEALQQRTAQQRAIRAQVDAMADGDDRLRHWAANTLLWGKAAPQLLLYADWLIEGDAARWHDAANHWNWDYGTEPLRWIISHPQCSAATALAIFYLAEPFDQPDKGDVPALLEMIRRRWSGPGFAHDDIGYALPHWVATCPPEQHVDTVPLCMRVTLPGRTVAHIPYADGIPAALITPAGG